MSLVGSLFGFQAERCWYIPFVWAPYNLRKRRCLSVHVGGSSVTVLSWGSFALSRYFVRRRWDDSTQSGAGVSFPIFSACFWFLCTRIYTLLPSGALFSLLYLHASQLLRSRAVNILGKEYTQLTH
jgi:hypothetical protein